MTNKTFCYLTQPDLMHAFDQDKTILLAKDLQKFQIILDEQPPAVAIKGSEVRPVKFLIVNNEKESINSISEEDIAKLSHDDDELVDDSQNATHFSSRTKFKKTDEIILFRRKIKAKSLNDQDKTELSHIASKVLTNNRHKGKSKFFYVNEQNLVLESDYSDPAFMQVDQPADVDYEENYSIEAPSIHDLFDMDAAPVDPLESHIFKVDEDEEMIEEYIIEEIGDDYEI